MGSLNIWNTSGANKASLTFTGSSDKTVDANTVLQSTDSTASIANGKVVVGSSGNVGIGVTPSAWLGSRTAIELSSGAINDNGAGSIQIGTNSYVNSSGSWTYRTNSTASNYYQYSGSHIWTTAPSGTAGNAISFTQVMTLDASGNLQFNSGYGSAATAYGCRAWVNFNGTGTVAIRASGNVSSITDNGVGVYGVNLTTSMPDVNYAISGTQKPPSDTLAGLGEFWNSTRTVSSYVISMGNASNYYDSPIVSSAVFR